MKARLNEGTLLVEAARADLRPGGRVEGEGRFDLAGGDGTWTLRAERLPDGLLAAYADEATRARWGIAGSELDGVATVRHGRGDPLPLSVDAELSLSRAGTALAVATARLESRGTDDARPLGDVPPRFSRRAARGGDPPGADSRGPRVGPPRRRPASRRRPRPRRRARRAPRALPLARPRGPGGSRPRRSASALDVRAAGPLRAPRAEVDAAFDPARGGSLSLRGDRRRRPPLRRRDGLRIRPLRSAPSAPARRASRRPTPRSPSVRRQRDAPRHPRRHRPLPRRGAAAPRERSTPRSRPTGSELRIVELAARPAAEMLRVRDAGLARVAASGRLVADGAALARRRPRRLRLRRRPLRRGARPPPRRRPRRSTSRARAGRGLEAILAARLPLGALRRRSCRRRAPPARPARGPARADDRRAGPRLLRSRGVPPRRDRTSSRSSGDLRGLRDAPPRRPARRQAAVALEGPRCRDAGRAGSPLSGPARLTLAGGRLALEAGHLRRDADVVPRLRLGRPRPRRAPRRGRSPASSRT